MNLKKRVLLEPASGYRDQDRKIVDKSQFSCRSGVISSAGYLSYILLFYDWKLANVMPIHKRGGKEDPSNYGPVILTLVPDKIMEQLILSVITQTYRMAVAYR